MGEKDYTVITNNPLVTEKLKGKVNVIYLDLSYRGILKAVRERVYEARRILSHPLAGNISPCRMPYRSVMISGKKGETDINSVAMIENAISFCGRFEEDSGQILPGAAKDFQLIDLELLKSAIESAEY